MFYDTFKKLCDQKGIKPGPAAQACGINRSNVSLWKSKGYTPRGDALQAIANYFNVSVDSLLNQEQGEQLLHPAENELQEYLEELKNRSEMRMLFKLSKNATKEQVEQAVKIIEALRK